MIGKMTMLLASASLAAGVAATPVRADDKAAAAAAAAIAILGIAALAHHADHYREGRAPRTPLETADFERGYRDGLHNEPYDSAHSSAFYGDGYDAGHKERANGLAHKAPNHNRAGAPRLAMQGCVGEASARWTRNPRDIHVVKTRKGTFSQAGGQEYRVEVAAGHRHGVCRVSQNGTVFRFRKGKI